MRVEHIGDATLYLGDCLEIMPTLGTVDAVVTDPPYGIDAGNMSLGKSAGSKMARSSWDKQHADISRLPKVPSIIWGGNYFPLPPSRCFLVWDKGAGFKGRDFAECEMAWCSFDANARVFSYNPLAKGDYRQRYHKTQKPVALMNWCLGFVAGSVLDPFMGSGTTGVACAKMGRKFIGIEINETYFDIACERIAKAYAQPDMFIEPPKAKAVNAELFGNSGVNRKEPADD